MRTHLKNDANTIFLSVKPLYDFRRSDNYLKYSNAGNATIVVTE